MSHEPRIGQPPQNPVTRGENRQGKPACPSYHLRPVEPSQYNKANASKKSPSSD